MDITLLVSFYCKMKYLVNFLMYIRGSFAFMKYKFILCSLLEVTNLMALSAISDRFFRRATNFFKDLLSKLGFSQSCCRFLFPFDDDDEALLVF